MSMSNIVVFGGDSHPELVTKICEPFTYKLTDLENDIEDISSEFNRSIRNLKMDKQRQLQTSKEFKSLSSVNHLPIIESGNFLWYDTDAAADWRTLFGKDLNTVLKLSLIHI